MYTAALLRGEHGDARSLWDWGIATRSGWWKGRQPFNPDKPRLSSHKDSRLPSDDWFLDYSLAFCALHPPPRASPRPPTSAGMSTPASVRASKPASGSTMSRAWAIATSAPSSQALPRAQGSPPRPDGRESRAVPGAHQRQSRRVPRRGGRGRRAGRAPHPPRARRARWPRPHQPRPGLRVAESGHRPDGALRANRLDLALSTRPATFRYDGITAAMADTARLARAFAFKRPRCCRTRRCVSPSICRALRGHADRSLTLRLGGHALYIFLGLDDQGRLAQPLIPRRIERPPMPRPTKYTEEKAAAICKAIENGNTFRVAALVNGCPLVHVSPLAQSVSGVFGVEPGRGQGRTRLWNDVVFASRKGDWNAAKFWLTPQRRRLAPAQGVQGDHRDPDRPARGRARRVPPVRRPDGG
jgi:hypothetical protein